MKNYKRSLAILTAAFLAATPLAATGLTAFAEDPAPTYNITVTPKEATTSAFSAYQIFTGTVSGGKLTNIGWGSSMPDDKTALLAALKADTVFGSGDENKFYSLTATDSAEKFADVMGTIINESDMANELAKVLDDFATTTPVTDGNAGTVNVIEGVAPGYYLVKETSPASSDNPKNPISLNLLKVVDGNVTIDAKEDLPTLDKKITGPNAKNDGKANAVSIGDTVSYEIDCDMPDMTGYSKYYYVINDTLSDGLTFDPTSVVVKIDNVALTAGTDYEVQTEDAAAPYTFQVVFKDFVNRTEAKDSPIVVTYNAVLNEDADRTSAGNLNTANLTYSNNPNDNYGGTPPTGDEPGDGEPVGTTPSKQTKTYTANIKLTKTDGTNALAGAKFSISGTSAKAVLINGTSYVKDNTNGTYYKLKNGTFTTTAPDGDEDLYDGTDKYKIVENIDKDTTYTDICMEAYVKADGTLEFGGLGAGTYTITELEAPAGYNMLSPASFTITIDNENASFDSPAWTASTNLSGVTVSMDQSTATASMTIVNKAGSTLPSTGGIGTKLFYIFGSLLVVGSGVLLITKKRMSAKEN